ncbi:MAG: biotin/lipoyl-binding protein [Clostridia bacterium]|nr:biotin/lipoyl-binding protein [Clostridia bacterium]
MEIKARVPAKVMEVNVKVGDSVKIKDIVAVLEAMKMKQPIPSPVDGVVKEIKIEVGQRINPGDVMVVVE